MSLKQVINSSIWILILTALFFRPFVCEDAFPILGGYVIFLLNVLMGIYLMLNIRKLKINGLNLAVIVFLVLAVLSLTFDHYKRLELYRVLPLITNILGFFLGTILVVKQEKQAVSILFISAVLIGTYAFYQYFFGLDRTIGYIADSGSYEYAKKFLNLHRIYAVFSSPNILASYLGMMFFAACGYLLNFYGKRKIYILFLLVILGIPMLLTKSLGALFALIIVSILFSMNFLVILRKFLIKHTKYLLLSAILSVIIFSAVFYYSRIIEVFTNAPGDNSFIQRIEYWKAGLGMIRDHPFIGVGWRRFGVVFSLYRGEIANFTNYTHNIFLQVFAETGIFGLVSFIIFIFFLIKAAIIGIRMEKPDKLLKLGIFCGVVFFLLHNIVDVSFYFGQVVFFWWFLAGLLTNYNILKDAN